VTSTYTQARSIFVSKAYSFPFYNGNYLKEVTKQQTLFCFNVFLYPVIADNIHIWV